MERICGISVGGSSAIFVILEGTWDEFHIVETTVKKIDLGDDSDQDKIKSFFSSVEDFFKENKINRIYVKKASSSGRFSASSKAFKIEGLIQFMSYDVKLVAGQTIAAFFKKNEPSQDRTSEVFKYQEEALKLALYGLGNKV